MPWIDELRIEPCPHPFHRRENLAQALEREELALQRHEHRVARGHGVDGQKIERRRTVDEDVGVGGFARLHRQRRHRLAQPKVPVGHARDLQLDAEQIERRRHDVEARHRGLARRPPQATLRRPARRRSKARSALRSTPSPVEALPCGSMSTISTVSPIAASAVPRLIAVVVLPTPPFWLASARTRGRSGSISLGIHGRCTFGRSFRMASTRPPESVALCRVYHIEVEGLRRRLDLLHIFLPFRNSITLSSLQRRARPAPSKLRQRRERPRRDDIGLRPPSSAHALRSARPRRWRSTPVSRIAARRNAAFLAFDSTSVNVALRDGSLAGDRHDESRETRRRFQGRPIRESPPAHARGAAGCRRRAASRLRRASMRATRLCARCHSRSSATKRSQIALRSQA